MPDPTTALRGCHLDAIRRRTLDARDGVYQTPADADREALLAEVDRLAGLSNARAIEAVTTPPDDTTALRETLIDALLDAWKLPQATRSRITREAAGRDVDAILAALAADPGDLPARMADAMRAHFLSEKSDSWSDGLSDGLTYCVCGETVASWNLHRAQAALSVRWEHAAHLAARVGDAERRAEKAESEHQVTQDRLAEARDERDLARKGRQEAHNRLEVAERMRPEDYYQQLEQISGNIADERIAHAAREHELAVLKAIEQRVREVAASPRSSMGRVNDYVPVTKLRDALDGGE